MKIKRKLFTLDSTLTVALEVAGAAADRDTNGVH